ncbi:hypothetical protein [Oceanomicrobium pacificus]|uniref:Nucleotidyltransferase n=1 Tax=Oceanomicrobium pacificus TaxID=2692916 RepID=A0A6B0TTN4_9RHOB|nr:hypothetical protein [Oceanomicrobium pacificus]MXU65018.1 hypothetical protein [Oceanomicrobium pacificus]
MAASIPTASDALIAALKALNAANLPFVVLRNHEGLPHHWSNDVDILVEPVALEEAHKTVLDAVQKNSANRPIDVMRRLNFRATRLSCADRVLQVDLYSLLSKAWVTYADTMRILEARQSANSLFAVPEPTHEALLIAAKELFSYREIRKRYHAQLAGFDAAKAEAAAESVFGPYVSSSGLSLLIEALKDPTVRGYPGLRLGRQMDVVSAVRWAALRRNGWIAQASIKGTVRS